MVFTNLNHAHKTHRGLGTAGPRPYLVGTGAALNALDSVRAARNLPEAKTDNAFVVWGESRGHTALFTGQLAASYAPELQLYGVVASAPAADLTALFKSKTTNPDAVGNLLGTIGHQCVEPSLSRSGAGSNGAAGGAYVGQGARA